MFGRGKDTIESTIREAVRRSDLGMMQKLWVQLVLTVYPQAMQHLKDTMLEKANSEEMAMGLVDADAWLTPEQKERLIEFFLNEILPILLELLKGLIG